MTTVTSTYGSSYPVTLTYRSILTASGSVSTLTIQPDIMNTYFYSAISKCQNDGNIQYCEILANLCVLALYDSSNPFCSAYSKIATTRSSVMSDPYDDQPQGLPWLFYGLINNELPQITQMRIPSITLDISGAYGVSSLPFYIGIYMLNGTFVGYRKLSTELELCQQSYANIGQWTRVGTNYLSTCSLNINNLASAGYSTYLYELFLQTSSGSYYPVPVRITNYRNSRGEQVNSAPSPTDWSNTKLFRRFFILDVDSGVVNGDLQVVRIASTVSVWINKPNAQSGTIYLPIVDITYTEREVSSLSASDTSALSTPTVNTLYTWLFFWLLHI